MSADQWKWPEGSADTLVRIFWVARIETTEGTESMEVERGGRHCAGAVVPSVGGGRDPRSRTDCLNASLR